MPRSIHGDKYTVSVMKNDENHIVFELSSKVIDFLVIENEFEPDTLVILSEEETVFIDLSSIEKNLNSFLIVYYFSNKKLAYIRTSLPSFHPC